MKDNQFRRVIADAMQRRYQFACTPKEFRLRYGVPSQEQADKLRPYIVVCKDLIIRPR
jgi:hypothetical protein